MNKLIRFIPLILFVLLGVVLYRGLFLNPQELPSALVGKPVPQFQLTKLLDESQVVTNEDLKGDIILLNVWATWCAYCKYEHPYLMNLARNPNLKIYGLNYKDERVAATQYLAEYKDPYVFSVFDETGKLGLDLGVYAAPETFVIDHKGIIRMRYAGPIDGNVWRLEFAPLIATIQSEMQQGS